MIRWLLSAVLSTGVFLLWLLIIQSKEYNRGVKTAIVIGAIVIYSFGFRTIYDSVKIQANTCEKILATKLQTIENLLATNRDLGRENKMYQRLYDDLKDSPEYKRKWKKRGWLEKLIGGR